MGTTTVTKQSTTTKTMGGSGTFTRDPAAVISDAFNRLVGPSEPQAHIPTPAEIEAQYKPVLAAAEAVQPPEGQPIPRQPSAIQATLALFAGNLGAALARNPALASNVMDILNQGREQAQNIAAKNYTERTVFNRDKQLRLLTIRADITEKSLNSLLEAGKLAEADKKAKELLKLQESLGAVRDEMKHQQQVTEIKTTGEETRKTNEAIGKGAKPELSLGDLLKARNTILTDKELNIDQRNMLEKFTQMFTGRKLPADREQSLDMIESAAVVEGSPQAKGAGTTLLFSRLTQRYNNDEAQVLARWHELGLPDEAIAAPLKKFLADKYPNNRAAQLAAWKSLGFPE